MIGAIYMAEGLERNVQELTGLGIKSIYSVSTIFTGQVDSFGMQGLGSNGKKKKKRVQLFL
jgi:hypothetical protein